MSDNNVDFLPGQEHVFKINFLTNEYVTSQHKDLTNQHNYLTRRHKDLQMAEIFHNSIQY